MRFIRNHRRQWYRCRSINTRLLMSQTVVLAIKKFLVYRTLRKRRCIMVRTVMPRRPPPQAAIMPRFTTTKWRVCANSRGGYSSRQWLRVLNSTQPSSGHYVPHQCFRLTCTSVWNWLHRYPAVVLQRLILGSMSVQIRCKYFVLRRTSCHRYVLQACGRSDPLCFMIDTICSSWDRCSSRTSQDRLCFRSLTSCMQYAVRIDWALRLISSFGCRSKVHT